VDKQPDEITERLDTLIRLAAVALIDGKKQRDQIRVLALAGLGPKQIAGMINTTQNTVNVALSALRREGELEGGNKAHGRQPKAIASRKDA
jgi:transposase